MGVCYDGPLLVGHDIEAKEAEDYEACLALTKKAYKKCDAYPPIRRVRFPQVDPLLSQREI